MFIEFERNEPKSIQVDFRKGITYIASVLDSSIGTFFPYFINKITKQQDAEIEENL